MRDNFMKNICFSLVFLFALFFSFSVNAAPFNISFDNTPNDATLVGSIVGQGSFQFGGDKTNGTYRLIDLSDYSFSFTFGETVFTEDEIYTTPLEHILVIFSDSGSGQQVNFKSDYMNQAFNVTKPFYGSIDFLDTVTEKVLSLDAGFSNVTIPTNYFLADTIDIGSQKAFGSYGPTPVPIPAAIWLLGSGIIGLVMVRRKSEK